MYYGEMSKTVVLPDHLFTDPDGEKLEYTSTGCTNFNPLRLGSSIRTDFNITSLYVFYKKFIAGSCQISVIATDPEGQSNTILIEVELIKWASKDWILWKGTLQIDWKQWISGYVLEFNTGSWLQQIQYQLFSTYSYYKLLGFITFLTILIPMLGFRYYGKTVLYPVMYAQIIIAIIYADSSISDNIKYYFEWLQILKLNFGFVNLITKLNQTSLWLLSGNKNLNEAGLYCSGFLMNYIYLIFILAALFLFKIIIAIIIKREQNITIVNLINSILTKIFSSKNMWWWFFFIVFIFPVWLILMDISNAK